jgi:hypothetical protein
VLDAHARQRVRRNRRIWKFFEPFRRRDGQKCNRINAAAAL